MNNNYTSTHQSYKVQSQFQTLAGNQGAHFLFLPQQVLITRPLSFADLLFTGLVSDQNQFDSFVNIKDENTINTYNNTLSTGESFIVAIFSYQHISVTEVNKINFVTVSVVAQKMGGIYFIIVNSALFVLTPFLYVSFLRTAQAAIGTTKKEEMKDKVSVEGLYSLYARVDCLQRLRAQASEVESCQCKHRHVILARFKSIEAEIE